jgi:hypothetical protein
MTGRTLRVNPVSVPVSVSVPGLSFDWNCVLEVSACQGVVFDWVLASAGESGFALWAAP